VRSIHKMPSKMARSFQGCPLPSADTRDLSDAKWAILNPLTPESPRRADGRGHPSKDRRTVLNGIVWVLRAAR
jgi:hypothetical protein